MPSRQATLSEASDDELASDLDDDDDEPLPELPDGELALDGVKTPAMLKREADSEQRKAKLLKKKQDRDAMEDQVSLHPSLPPPA